MKRIFIALVFIPNLILASSNIDSLKYEIIKATVNFYGSDKPSFKDSKGKPSKCSYPNYDCLKKYCDDNKLEGVFPKVGAWREASIKNIDDLIKLKEKVVSEVLTKKKDREKLAGYKSYTDKLDEIIASYSAEANLPAETEKPSEPIKPAPIINNEPPIEKSKESSILLIVSLILSIIAILLGVFNFRENKNKRLKSKLNKDDNLQIMQDEIKWLKSNAPKNSTNGSKDYEEKIKTLERRILQLENQPRTSEMPINEKKTVQQNNNPVSSIQNKFAKLPDLGNGFSSASLIDSQNGEQIYEIELNGDKGVYSISKDDSAQKYALTDYKYYLNGACEFKNQPIKNCVIETSQKGTLSKSSKSWIIDNKATIEFK